VAVGRSGDRFDADDELLGFDDRPPGEDRDHHARHAPPEQDLRVAIVKVTDFRDVRTVGEHYRQKMPVIVNLEALDVAEAKRVVDFVAGLVFGSRGDVERLSGRIFLMLPPSTTVLRI
jgi:cell division inhibitor SepF